MTQVLVCGQSGARPDQRAAWSGQVGRPGGRAVHRLLMRSTWKLVLLMNAAFSVLVIAVVCLLAWIAQLKHKKALAIALVVLVGVLIGNAPGNVGDWSQTTADFVNELPKNIANMVNGH